MEKQYRLQFYKNIIKFSILVFVCFYISFQLFMYTMNYFILPNTNHYSTYQEYPNSISTIDIDISSETGFSPQEIQINYDIQEIRINPNKLEIPEDAEVICVTSLNLFAESFTNLDYSRTIKEPLLKGKICNRLSQAQVDLRDQTLTIITIFDRIININEDSGNVIHFSDFMRASLFLYPYDYIDLRFIVSANISIYDSDEKLLLETTDFPSLSSRYYWGSEWISNTELVSKSHRLSGNIFRDFDIGIPDDFTEPTFKHINRPTHLQILFPISFTSLLILILLLFKTEELASYIRGAFAFLFGVYSLREILSPNDFPGSTLIDYTMTILYFIFSLSIIYQSYTKLRKEFKIFKPN